MQKRLFRLLLGCGIALAAGLLYAHLVRVTGFGIPCIFHTITGLDCPSCGVTRMCMALLRLDFAAAFRYNAAILVLSPLGIAVAAAGVALCEDRARKTFKGRNGHHCLSYRRPARFRGFTEHPRGLFGETGVFRRFSLFFAVLRTLTKPPSEWYTNQYNLHKSANTGPRKRSWLSKWTETRVDIGRFYSTYC